MAVLGELFGKLLNGRMKKGAVKALSKIGSEGVEEAVEKIGKTVAKQATTKADDVVRKAVTKIPVEYADDAAQEIAVKRIGNSLPKSYGDALEQTAIAKNLDNSSRFLNKPMYHSTDAAPFTKFDNSKLGSSTGYDNTSFGHFITDDVDFSKTFGKNTLQVQPSFKNPITHPMGAQYKYSGDKLDKIVEDYFIGTNNMTGLDYLKQSAAENGQTLWEEFMDATIDTNPYDFIDSEKDALIKNGYDAVEFVEGPKNQLKGLEDNAKFANSTNPVSSYAVFNPDDLKILGELKESGADKYLPGIRMEKKGETLADIAHRIKAMRAAQNMSDGVKRIGSAEVSKIDKSTLPAGYDIITKYMQKDPTAMVEDAIGSKIEDVDFADKLVKFLEDEGYEVKPNVVDNLNTARQVIADQTADELNMAGASGYGKFLQTRAALQKDNPGRGVGVRAFTIDANDGQLYQTDAAKLDREYSDRLGIGRSHTPMSDKVLSNDAQGYYMAGGIGVNPLHSSGESGVSTIAHERMHSWQDINKGEWDSRVGDAIDELRDELKNHYHTKAEIKAYRKSGSDLDYYAGQHEQEARMLQSYLDNEGFTNTWRKQNGEAQEWGDEIKPAFDKFYKKLRALSKAGVALPAIALLFGLSANGGEQKEKTIT